MLSINYRMGTLFFFLEIVRTDFFEELYGVSGLL